MKRTLLIMFMAVSAIFMAGCTKNNVRNLDGTVWSDMISGQTTTLRFTKNQCELLMSSSANPDEPIISRDFYSYEFDSQEDTVMMHPERSGKAVLKGIISGNIMSVINTSNGQTIGFFTKQ